MNTLAPSRTRASVMDYDAIRGILILIVMFDHNDIIRQLHAVNAWFLPMTFHVAGFLLLPFLLPAKRLSWPMARDHAVRYLVPFLFAVLAYAAAYQALMLRRPPDLARLGAVLTALVFADPASLQVATGFIVLWFLPALLSLVLLSALYNAAGTPVRRILLAAALAVHLGIGAAPQGIKSAVPQGLLVALYVFPLGLIVRAAVIRMDTPIRRQWVVAGSALLLLACWLFERGREVEVATLVLPTLAQPLMVAATDISDLAFLAGLVLCSPVLGRVPGLRALGRNSLLIYLVHPLLYKPILAVLLRICTPALAAAPGTAAVYWAGAVLSVASVAAASLAASRAVQAWPWSRALITPRGLADWLPVTLCERVWSKRA